MAIFTTSRFGDLVLESDGDGFVRREIAVNGRTATCSLFVNGTVPVALLGRAAALVDTLDLLDARARDSLRSELADDTDVASFLQFHLDELSASELHERFGDDSPRRRCWRRSTWWVSRSTERRRRSRWCSTTASGAR